jgi:hypothetical protein
MSEILVPERSQPIEIPYNRYSYALPFSNNNKYLFELTINTGKKTKIIRRMEESKTSEIISGFDKIPFKKIKSFKIKVYVIPDDNIHDLELIGKINNDFSTFTKTNKRIYIEFLKNPLGYTLCSCTVVIPEGYSFSLSPPM